MLSPIAALESPSVHASHSLRRVAHAHLAEAFQPVYQAYHTAAAVTPLGQAADLAPMNQDLLRDRFADDRLHRAVDQYQPPAQAQSTCAGAGWGSVDCLLPTQPYRVAQGNPPMEVFDALVPPPLRRLAVNGVQNVALDEGFESARQRRQLAA